MLVRLLVGMNRETSISKDRFWACFCNLSLLVYTLDRVFKVNDNTKLDLLSITKDVD